MKTNSATYPDLTTHKRLPALDGIRGFAAAWVFFYHYLPGNNSASPVVHLISSLNRIGWSAVSLFFVLSGFLISGILWDSFEEDGWWKKFYKRRSLRIFPLYYLALLLCVVFFLLTRVPRGSIQHLWIHVFYLQDVPSLLRWGGELPTTIFLLHFWSLAVEEQFYLLWPFLLWIISGKRNLAMKVIIGFWLLSLLFRLGSVFYNSYHPNAISIFWSSGSLPGRSGELFAGALLALLLRGSSRDLETLNLYLPWVFGASFLGFFGVLLASPTREPENALVVTLGLSFGSISYACLIATSLRKGWWQTLFQWKFLRWLGSISYGIYVYHMLLLPQFQMLRDLMVPNLEKKGLRATVLMLLAMAITLLISTLSFHFIEKPLVGLNRRGLKRTQATPAVNGPVSI